MIRATAPATIANLGAGFDAFGISIDAARDVVEVSRASVLKLSVIGADLPEDPELNTAGRALRAMTDAGLEVRIRKGVPPSSGLGSSAASAAAAVVAANALLGLRFAPHELVRFAAEGEIASAGTAHRDNVAAAIFGGFTIALEGGTFAFAPPAHLAFAVRLPRIALRTEESRRVLPHEVSLRAMADSIGAAGAFVCAMMSGDVASAARVAEGSIVDRARESLIPGFAEMARAARAAGAEGVVIAGAGPAVAAFVDERRVDPATVARAMGPDAFVTRPAGGAHVEA